jgi:hypothetical protein
VKTRQVGRKGCFRAFLKAQASSGADFGGKWQIPTQAPIKPLAIFKRQPFSHSLQAICLVHRVASLGCAHPAAANGKLSSKELPRPPGPAHSMLCSDEASIRPSGENATDQA